MGIKKGEMSDIAFLIISGCQQNSCHWWPTYEMGWPNIQLMRNCPHFFPLMGTLKL